MKTPSSPSYYLIQHFELDIMRTGNSLFMHIPQTKNVSHNCFKTQSSCKSYQFNMVIIHQNI